MFASQTETPYVRRHADARVPSRAETRRGELQLDALSVLSVLTSPCTTPEQHDSRRAGGLRLAAEEQLRGSTWSSETLCGVVGGALFAQCTGIFSQERDVARALVVRRVRERPRKGA